MSWKDWLGFLRKLSTATAAAEKERWVVLDVETSGLDTNNDQLLAIACVAVNVDWKSKQLTLMPGDSFEIIVKPTTLVTDKTNILVHNIGQQSQERGVPLDEALKMLMNYAEKAPLLAFHSGFDERILANHTQRELNSRLPNAWLDIAQLCKAIHPKIHADTLDDWLTHFGIVCSNRHSAAADAWAEGEVLQRLWPHIARQCSNWRDMQRLIQQRHWMR